MNLQTVEIKAFVPARELERSLAFYRAIGFEVAWCEDGLACLHHGACSFLLQAFDAPGFAANFQMHLLVENADDWHASVLASGVGERFGVAVGDPEDRPWAMRDFTLHDPAGVLWRIGHALPDDAGRGEAD